MATQREFTITGGPSKFDLMISLFYGGTHQRMGVHFQLDNPGVSGAEVNVFIDQIQREDGSGESWNISGEPFYPFLLKENRNSKLIFQQKVAPAGLNSSTNRKSKGTSKH